MKKIIYFAFSLTLLNYSCSNESIYINQNISDNTSLISNRNQSNFNNKKKFTDSELKLMYAKPIKDWEKAILDQGIIYRELGNLSIPKHPVSNPYSFDKAELGKVMFFDNKLSKYNMFSCASCHNPQINWADDLDKTLGNDKLPLKRNSPSVVNTAYHSSMFWDGRAKTLESQANDVLLNPKEMNSSETLLKRVLGKEQNYLDMFRKSFGDEEINLDRVTKALATFQRTLVTKNNSPFDRFIKGDYNSLSNSQIRGLHLFRTKARCMTCHNGENFSDNNFHNTGLVMQGTQFEDLGKFDTTNKPQDYGVFRTASLRNAAKTTPYFHHGQTKTISEIIKMYNSGMPQSQNKSKLIKPLGLTSAEMKDLENFIQSLSEDMPIISRNTKIK